jgi:hypothetical protein
MIFETQIGVDVKGPLVRKTELTLKDEMTGRSYVN